MPTAEVRAAQQNATAALNQSGGTATVEVNAADLRALVAGADQETTNWLWLILVGGLMTLTGFALIGTFYLIADDKAGTSPDLALTMFTALLTGMLGLFIKSPREE
jgi:hypothetical protein